MYHFIVLGLKIEWTASTFQNSCFPLLLKAQLHHSHIWHSLLPTFESKPNFLSFLLFFFFGFFLSLGFGSNYKSLISPSCPHLVLSICYSWILQGWSTPYALFRPYVNGLIKEFKHKDQCPIYNSIPSYFGKFIFSWKTYLNLYLKWTMTFKSPHFFSSFLFFFHFWIFFFFWRKKSDQVLSQPIKVFYLFYYKAHLKCSLSSLMKALPLVSKVWSIFIFILIWALPLVQRVWLNNSNYFIF